MFVEVQAWGEYRQVCHFLELSLTSLPTTFLASQGLSPWSGVALALFWCSSSLVCCSNEEGVASFYRWRGKDPREYSYPLVEGANRPSSTLIPPPYPCNSLWRGGKRWPAQDGADWSSQGCGHTRGVLLFLNAFTKYGDRIHPWQRRQKYFVVILCNIANTQQWHKVRP